MKIFDIDEDTKNPIRMNRLKYVYKKLFSSKTLPERKIIQRLNQTGVSDPFTTEPTNTEQPQITKDYTRNAVYGCDGTNLRILSVDADGKIKLSEVDIPGITKGVSAVSDWTAVAQNVVGESETLDCSTHYGTLLHIQAALDTTTAHTGTRFIVQVSSATSGDEDWQDYTEFIGLIGTAKTDLIEDNPLAAGSKTIALTGTAYTAVTQFVFIEDGTLANSELGLKIAKAANSITLLDGTTNAHAQNVALFDIALSQVVLLDASIVRARVLVDNKYDADGSTLNYKVRATQITVI